MGTLSIATSGVWHTRRPYTSDQGSASGGPREEPDCPELPSTPSWSLNSLLKRRDAISTSPDHSRDITPETIDHLLDLAHLRKPEDPLELKRLERDVRRMRNFLNYIRSTDNEHQPSATVESLRSLVDDGEGLRLRPTVSNDLEKKDDEQELIKRRDMLLTRPSRVKGNFFVVGTALEPKDEN
ncbi:hypothetical protein EDD21DRAFT_25078 [Dissophora ornata]|nr:hypothetical protein EDD21DRAFT_25078 [Dissophora ornata]